MEISYLAVTILQAIGVSLGVGSSTIAVSQFFVAISNGKIGEAERRMLGVVYIVLRVAMGTILVTTLAQAAIIYQFIGLNYFNPFTVGVWSAIFVLFVNAVMMTLHWMPYRFGPGLQAGSWYTLGISFSLVPLGLTSFSYEQFFLAYAGALVLGVAIVNGIMNYLESRRG